MASRRPSPRPARTRDVASHTDRTLERTAALNQLLLASVVLVVAVLIVVVPFDGDLGLFFAGVVLVFFATGAALVVPWNDFAPGWVIIIPVADIAAITLMRLAAPDSRLGLLWVFPGMWIAAAFGLIGLVASSAAIVFLFALTAATAPAAQFEYTTVLQSLVIVAVSGTSYLGARRSTAQRTLLDKQAVLLGRALDRAREQEQSVIEVLDAVDFGVIRIAADGSTTITNDTHARLQHALARENDADDVPAYRADGVTPVPEGELPLERALRGESFDGQIVWFGDPGPDRAALSVSVRRIHDPLGADAGAVLVSRDVTVELDALRARDDLVASVSHELRTPLTSILGYLDLAIDDETVPDRARKQLEIAERNAERLLAIIADILAASTASSSSVELTILPRAIDVAEVIRASVESLQPRAAERAVLLDTAGVESATAYADPMRVRQVVDNLITNGIKYNRDGGMVTVGSTSDGDVTWILVRDSGMGMTEDETSGLFERFYRAKSTRDAGVHGTGLGLSISRDIARAHGGDITVRSTPGVGSTFIVRLPSTRAAATPAPRMPAPEPPPDPLTAFGPRRRGGAVVELGPPQPAERQPGADRDTEGSE